MSHIFESENVFYNCESEINSPKVENFTNQFLSTLRNFDFQKIYELKMLIIDAINFGNIEIIDCYKILVEEIFNTDKETNWNLFMTPNLSNQNEFSLLYNFLCADGDLFNLVKYLMNDSTLKYLFPVSKLPEPTRILIEQGITPNFYINKVYNDSLSLYPTKISLNPFEFYFFHFSHYVKNFNAIFEVGNNSQIRILFLNLLETYLVKFLPTNNDKNFYELNDKSSQNSLWKSLSTTTSNLLHLGQQSNKTTTILSNTQKPSLLNLKPLQNYSLKQLSNESLFSQKSIDSYGTSVYKSETLINIFTEMWLNINVPPNLTKKKSSSNNKVSNFCPNVIHMMCVRIYIKRLHFFANCIIDKKEMSNMPAFENHEFDELRKSIWTSKFQIQKKFYSFLKNSFEHWPCDSSFRVPLETWLSFIRPWRYFNEMSNAVTEHQNLNNNLNRWKNFIQENILFYTTVFYDVLPRFINIDLLSLKNSYMLSRIAKVYLQQNFIDLIKEAEANCDISNSWLASASIRGSLLSPTLRNNSQSVCHKDLSFTNLLEENEKTGFVYISFLSEDIKKSVMKLVSKIVLSIEKINKLELKSTEKKKHHQNQLQEFISFFFSSSNSYDDDEKQNLDELSKIKNILETTKEMFLKIFSINPNEIEINDDENLETFDNSFCKFNFSENKSIDQSINQESIIFNKNLNNSLNLIKSNQIKYNGNPDIQPVRTYEFYFLVIILNYLSEMINNYYKDSLSSLYYSQNSFLGYLARFFLAKPHKYITIEKNGILPPIRISRTLPPRVNLRFLASKSLYAYLFLFYIFLKVFLFSKPAFLITIFFIFIITFTIKLANS